jgi:ankyrin repeat protein
VAYCISIDFCPASQLLGHGIVKDAIDNHGRNVLHLATCGGHLETVNYLLDIGMDAAVKDNRGFTSIHYVAASGSFFCHHQVSRKDTEKLLCHYVMHETLSLRPPSGSLPVLPLYTFCVNPHPSRS